MATTAEERVFTFEAGPAVRADARRNMEAVLDAAVAVFEESGVDVPMRTIAARAGVGVGTLYRHFPQRSDLIKAIIRGEVFEQRDAAQMLAAKYPPGQALALWLHRLIGFVGARRGLGPALQSGDGTDRALSDFVLGELTIALEGLIGSAAKSGAIREGVEAGDLLAAGLRLAVPGHDGSLAQARRMMAMLIDGLGQRPREALG